MREMTVRDAQSHSVGVSSPMFKGRAKPAAMEATRPVSLAFSTGRRIIVLILCLQLHFSQAQNATCDKQPTFSDIDPPSGTTGTFGGVVTTYTITGALLDEVQSVLVESGGINNTAVVRDRSNTSLQFQIPSGVQLPRVEGGTPTRVLLVAMDSECQTASITISLHQNIQSQFSFALEAQPGTVIFPISGSCFPSICGDNSTEYNITVGGILLENFESNADEFIARFPNFDNETSNAEVSFVTQYQTFTLFQSQTFDLFLPGVISSVSPRQGQKGTAVEIRGSNLIGFGSAVDLLRVTLGNVSAIITDPPGPSSNQLIQLQVQSGIPGANLSVRINTTQRIMSSSGQFSLDGPYTFLENAWTQLEDGVITDIIPLAAQVGSNVTLCGERLLGGGSEVSTINLAGILSAVFTSTPSPSSGLLPQSECLTVEVPNRPSSETISGSIVLVSDTQAIVDSVQNFTFAEIRTVRPPRGQFGTRVTITGDALLSGYDNQSPTVFLFGVEATLLSFSSSEVVVEANMPADPELTSGGVTVMPEIFGTSGAVEVVVNSSFGLSFSVSTPDAWTFERPGEVEAINPFFGTFGTRVTITGSNLLGYGIALTHATVDGVNATILNATDAQVTLAIPSLSSTGLVNLTLFSVTGAEVTAERMFEYRSRGEVAAVSPSSGQFGTYVDIIGTDLLGHGSNATSVTFAGIPATIDFTQTNNTRIRVRVAANNNTADTQANVVITADTFAVTESSLTSVFWTYIVQGAIAEVTPGEGQAGTTVTITGSSLLGGGGNISEIFLDGVEALVMPGFTDTSISVVMGDISNQRLDLFPGQVYITSDTGAIVSGGAYTHRESGRITSFTPQFGRMGTIISLSGNNLLGFGSSVTNVLVAGFEGSLESIDSNSSLSVRAGDGDTGAQGPIQLTINTGAVIFSTDNFTYEARGSISDVTPTQGAEGSGVLVTGSALRPNATRVVTVTIGGSPVSRIVTESLSSVSVIAGPAPLSNPSMAEIIITASDGSFVRGAFFSYINLTIALPDRNSGREGTLVNISLPDSFTPSFNLRATIDELQADIVTAVSTEGFITVAVPRGRSSGAYSADVAVETTTRLVARLRNGFTFVPEGVICTVSPSVGQRGTRVTLQGTNLLGGGSSIESAMLAGEAAMVNSSSEEEVMVAISSNPPSPVSGDIVLVADSGAIVRRLSAFTFVEPGRITTVNPPRGHFGTIVNIFGSGLLQGDPTNAVESVTLAGVPAIVQDNATDSLITVQAQGSVASTQASPVEIVLLSGAIIESSEQVTFEYLQPGEIVMVAPNIGTVGTRLQITGTNLLGGGTSIESLTLNGAEANVTGFSDTAINVTAQQGDTIGAGAVTITSNTGAIVTDEDGWTYQALGVIESVTPSVGQQGVRVTISGVSLLGSSASSFEECTLAGIPAEIVQPFSDTEVTCIAGFDPTSPNDPAGSSGPAQLTTDTGVVITSTLNFTNFTYYFASINRIEPTSGNNGTIVSITGQNLFGFPGSSETVENVFFGDVEVLEIINSATNNIQVRVGPSENETTASTVRVLSSSGAFLELQNAWNYTGPGEITSLSSGSGFPGSEVVVTGRNLVPPNAASVVVILGQTQSFSAEIINSSTVSFRAGVYQSVAGDTPENLDTPEEDLPVQLVSDGGQTVFNGSVTFSYNATGVVISYSPTAGQAGTRVTIMGRNLIRNGTNISQVYLAGVPVGSIENATEELVIVTAGAPPPEGVVGSVVLESDDGTLTGLAGEAWTYYPLITASSVSPRSGQNGTIVTIDRSRVQDLPVLESVSLAGVPAFIVSLNALVLTLQAQPSNATTIRDIVFNFSDNITLSISDAWSYEPPVAISSISPSNGYFNTLVTITGVGFQAGGVNVSSVYLAGVQTTVETQTDTQITVRISEELDSSSAAITGPVVIQSSEGATFTSVEEFTYVQLRVDSVSPRTGQRGTNVIITGVGILAGGNTITTNSFLLGDIQATVQNATDSEVTVVAGALPAMTNVTNITYTLDTGAMVTIPNSWQYIAPGEVTGITPAEGNLGTIVTITGRRLFAGGSRADALFLNGVQALEILVNDEEVVQVISGGSSQSLSAGSVQIVSDTGSITESSGAVQFSYLAPGEITSISLLRGQNGTRLTVAGTMLHNGEGVTRVLLAGVEATIESIDAAQQSITVRAGRPSTLGEFSGRVTVQSNFNTTTSSSVDFTYLAEGRICSVSPLQGQRGTNVTIEGENLLGGGASIQQVFLAGVEADFISATSTVVMVTARAFPNATLGDIVLISDTQAYVRRINGWSYVQEGTIESVSPLVGQFGTEITITGSNLQSGGDFVETVLIDDIAALEIIDPNGDTVVARAGDPPTTGNFTTSSMTLISNHGGELRANVSWTYLPASSIISVNPPNGNGDMQVTITGTNLLGGGSIIERVITDNIPAAQIILDNSNREVIFRTGINTGGQSRIGDIILESDTGARTVLVDGWTYNEECPAGMFGTLAAGCEECSAECGRCFGALSNQCTACVNFRIVLDSSSSPATLQCVSLCPNVSTLDRECRDACNLNQYSRTNSSLNTIFCYDCHGLCDQNLGCSGPEPTECQQCQFFFNTLNQSCVESCPVGTFVNERRECTPCHPQCEMIQASGCRGPGASDCNACANVRISSLLSDIDDSSTGPTDFCIEQCPSRFFMDEESFCQPCAPECATTCSGSTAFDCDVCQNFSVSIGGRRQCVATCNPDTEMMTMYSDMSRVCQRCDNTCSLTGGCTGPTASDCNGCRIDNITRLTLPTFEGTCLLACPNISYYSDNRTLRCELCSISCTNGCTGPSSTECISSAVSIAFQAGAGTIAIVIVIIVILAILVVLIGILWLISIKKRDKYNVPATPPPTSDLEMGEGRYSSRTGVQETALVTKDASPVAINLGFSPEDGDLYTAMGPEEVEEKTASMTPKPVLVEELYTDVPQENTTKTLPIAMKSEDITGSQDLYTDMEPAPMAPVRPPKPAEKEPAPLPAKTEPKPTQKAPSATGKPPPRPPTPETYTDMEANVTEVYVNPVTEEEYSEMASPNPDAVGDELYEDAGSMAPSHGAKPPPLQLPKQGDDEAPLISSIDDAALYEDTDTAIAAVEEYKRATFPRSTSGEVPPSLPSRPAPPKKRLSTPLPLTPLQKSLTGSGSLPGIPAEDLYEAAEGPIEESLYEDISGLSKKLLPERAQPPPPDQRVSKKNSLPLPPRK